MTRLRRGIAAILLPLVISGCHSMAPLETVDQVDLQRFMGDWYVIANIPTSAEKGAHNAVESYALAKDGTVATTFTFRDGAFDGPLKTYHPRGFVREGTGNAVWGMRLIWPFKADYRIVYLDADYTTTVIGRNKRDYVWIMAREPAIPEGRYAQIVSFLESVGYDVTKLQVVPQQW